MSSSHQLALHGVQNGTIAPIRRRAVIQKRLERFSHKHRTAVKTLAARHDALADLALSFPALLFALAVPRAGIAPEPIIERAMDGCGLNELARMAQLPRWSRKMLPETFVTPIEALPDGELYSRQIGNFVPRSPLLSAKWLEAVSFAAAWGHSGFSIWVARVLAKKPKTLSRLKLRRLALWSWYSIMADTKGHGFVGVPWSPSMGHEQAIRAADDWLETATLHVAIGEAPLPDMWCQPSTHDGYEFVGLQTAEEISVEAKAMKNCLRSYGGSISLNRARIWSVRKSGERVACLQLGQFYVDKLPAIVEIRSHRNHEAPREVALAARKWLNSHDLSLINPDRKEWRTVAPDREAWISLWRPYWIAKRKIPGWLPLSPSSNAIRNL